MKEKMRKQTLVKRVLALVMTLVMVIGLLPSAPAKAADAVQVVFTGVKSSEATNKTRLYITTSATNSLAGGWTMYYPDSNSGVWYNGTQLSSSYGIYKVSDNEYRIEFNGDNQAAVAGSTIITVEGTFTSTAGASMAVEKTQFQYTSSGWALYTPPAEMTVVDMTNETFNINKNSSATVFYLDSVYKEALGTSVQYFADTTDANSGIWLDETKLNVKVQQNNASGFYQVGSFGVTATEGQILTIKGEFYNQAKTVKLIMPEMQFQYTSAGWVKYTPVTVVDMTSEAFTVKSNSSATVMYLTSTKKEELGKNVPYYADDDDETSGVWLDGEKLKTNTKIQPDGSGVYQVGSFYDASWNPYTAEKGSILVIKGEFCTKDETIKLIMPTLQFQFDGTTWIVYSAEKGDYTANLGMDSRDLVRLKRYLRDSDTEISIQAEFNGDNKLNHADADELRWALVWGYTYDDNGIALGMPGYSNKKTLESMAYSAPEVGTWNTDNTEFTPYEDSKIDEAFANYKEAGLVLISNRHVAPLMDADINGELNEPFRVFMEAADRNGLKVLVDIDYINAVKDVAGRDDKTSFNNNYACADDTGMFDYKYMKVVYNQVCNKLINYPAFAGVLISDEWPAVTAGAFVNIMKALEKAEVDMREAGELNEDLIFTTSQYPITVDTSEDADILTTDLAKQGDLQAAYKDYITQFGKSGKFTYDLYALEQTGTKGKYVNEEWFTNLRLVSELALSQGIYHTGITIQSSRIKAFGTSFERYAPEQQTDIGFQIYTALAYGMKEIHYFTYNDHPTDNTVQASMIDNTNIYTSVQALNAEIAQFDNVLLHFKWKGALDLAAGNSGTGAAANSTRLASASVSGARAIVGCMKDIYGFDGYMVANAAGPRTPTASNVTLTFNDADKVVIYKDGVKSVETLSNNAVTLTVPVGEGIFVIPVKSN